MKSHEGIDSSCGMEASRVVELEYDLAQQVRRAQAAEARAEAEKRRADGHELALRQFIQLARAQGIEITHFECRPDDAALAAREPGK